MEKREIDFGDGGRRLYELAIDIMERSGMRFSVVLDREHKLEEADRTYIKGYCPSWLRLRGELRQRGLQGVLGEIVMLEVELMGDTIERRMLESYNDGDKDSVDLCRKTLDGIISKAKIGMSKTDSDYKRALDALDRGGSVEKLREYSDEELKLLLEGMRKEDGGDNGESD